MTRRLRLFAIIAVASMPLSIGAATVVETLGDASILHAPASGTWTIAAGGASLTLGLDASRDFEIESLIAPSGQSWVVGGRPGTTLSLGGTPVTFGSRTSGFRFEGATASNDGHVLQLDAAFTLQPAGLRAVRHFVVAAGSPTFETWTTFQSLGPSINLSNLNAFALSVPSGTVHWVTGLQGDSTDPDHDTAFALQQRDLEPDDTLALGAQTRSSEQAVPWFAIDGVADEFYAGLMWSGAWSMTMQRSDDNLTISLGLAPMSTRVVAGTDVDGPHALFGVARGGLPEASAAQRAFVQEGIRQGRGFFPLVTYNTWFAYGTAIDEESMRAEMDSAAALGTERFVIDAGWYAGAGAADAFDFDAGLGSWEVDPDRFPNGLKPLTDYAHDLGMKVGIWVEPERVNLSTIGAPGPDESWLATSGGSYGSDHAAQVCLFGSAARRWVLARLTSLIDEVQPDYLKWDNNMAINCDRGGHGHLATDGNFAHVTALYDVLAQLRAQYPNLVVEDCSGGGNRLDFGMLRYTDVAWMDDRTDPSVHVRHDLEGLATVFPPAYLLSFVTDYGTEPMHDAPDLPLYFRSRMAGAFGLSFHTGDLSESDVSQITREIAIYKDVRATLGAASGTLLTVQAAVNHGPEWDALQATAPGAGSLLMYAYQSEGGTPSINLKPSGLQPDAIYVVTSVDTGALGAARGADLMADGIDLVQSPNSAAHMLTLVVPEAIEEPSTPRQRRTRQPPTVHP